VPGMICTGGGLSRASSGPVMGCTCAVYWMVSAWADLSMEWPGHKLHLPWSMPCMGLAGQAMNSAGYELGWAWSRLGTRWTGHCLDVA
jgi:hypothetical protein